MAAMGKAFPVKTADPQAGEPCCFSRQTQGQGDTKERSGGGVSVLVAGTFSSPMFRPDLEKYAQAGFYEGFAGGRCLIDRLKEQQDQGKEALKKTLEKGVLGQKQVPTEAPKEGSSQQEKPKTPVKQAKELLKGLPFSK